VKIVVFDNQVEAALKQLKKQMLRDGLYQEMKKRACSTSAEMGVLRSRQ
jgi:ribosomal protein S21